METNNEYPGSSKDSLETILRKMDVITANDKFSEPEKEKIKNFKNNIQLKWSAYQAKSRAYEDAVLEYNKKRMSALSGTDQKDVMDFSLNGAIYKQRVTVAMNAWKVEGNKDEVEGMLARLDQMTADRLK